MPIDPITLTAMVNFAAQLEQAIERAIRGEQPTNDDLTAARVASQVAHDALNAEIEAAKARNASPETP